MFEGGENEEKIFDLREPVLWGGEVTRIYRTRGNIRERVSGPVNCPTNADGKENVEERFS